MKLLKFKYFLESISIKETSKILYSERLRDILKKMNEYGSGLAESLLLYENRDDIRDDITLFDITDKSDSISFIQVNRLSKIKDSDSDDESVKLNDWIYRKWYQTNNTLSFPGWKTQRTNINIGRFLTRIFRITKKPISDKLKEEFVNLYKSMWKISNESTQFELVKGENIKKWYLEDNYQFDKGQLSNSCMRYHKCQKYFDIYTKNPEVCSLLILHGDDITKIIGRALIWNAIDTDGSECLYMDRIYTNFDSDTNLFINWANKNNIKYSYKMEDLKVNIKEVNFNYYPYMDTFCFLNKEKSFIIGDESKADTDDYYELLDTDGSALQLDRVWSDIEGTYIDTDDAVYCDDINDYCHVDNGRYLSYLGIWVHYENDNVVYSSVGGDYYYMDDCYYSNFLEDWILVSKSVEVKTSSTTTDFLPDNKYDYHHTTIEINGSEELVLIDAVMLNPLNNKWIFKKDEIDVYWCDSLDKFIDIEYSKNNKLSIDKNNKKTMLLGEYIPTIYPQDIPSESELVDYLAKLEPTEEQSHIISNFRLRRFYFTRITDGDVWNIIKFGIFNFPNDKERRKNMKLPYISLKMSGDAFEKILGEKTFDKVGKPTIDAIVNKFCNYMVYDIIKDKKMLMRWSIMVNK